MSVAYPRCFSEEQRRAVTEYYCLFGVHLSTNRVGLKRMFEAIAANEPIPESEYENIRATDNPTHCWAETLEEEQAVIDYERIFAEECPLGYVDCARIKQAIADNTPIPESEYEHLLHIV